MKIDEAYNIWANIYDSNDNKTRDLELTIGKSILENTSFSKIVELGCGTGKNTEWLINICDNLLGVDFSTEMLSKARTKIDSEKVSFLQSDLTNKWEFADNSANLITSSLILEHIENLEFIFSEAYRALDNNGMFYICELHPFKQYAGTKARFEVNDEVIKLETYTHHTSDYLQAAKINKFKLLELNEWFDDEDKAELPRLISFIFEKD